MSGTSQKREELIRKLKDLTGTSALIITATVDEVDEEAMTIVVTPPDGPQIFDVRLKAAVDEISDGMVEIPAVGSTVLIAMIGKSNTTWYMLATSQVDKVVFYGGSNGGLIKIEELVDRLNTIENKVNDLIGYINGHSHASNGSPPAPAYTGGALANTMRDALENENVVH